MQLMKDGARAQVQKLIVERQELQSRMQMLERSRDAACDPADSDSQAISLFAGIFATAFQTCLLLAKPLAGALLTAWPDATQLPFAVYTALAVAFTLLMAALLFWLARFVLLCLAIGILGFDIVLSRFLAGGRLFLRRRSGFPAALRAITSDQTQAQA